MSRSLPCAADRSCSALVFGGRWRLLMKQTCNSKNQESRVTEVSEVADASMYHLSVEELLELSLRTERGKWAEPLPYGFCGEEGIWPGSKLHKLHLRLPSQTL